MTMIKYYVATAKYLQDYQLKVTFQDQSIKIVDLAPKLKSLKPHSVFEPLKDKTYFKTFYVGESKDTIYWNNGLDISSAYLYENGVEFTS